MLSLDALLTRAAIIAEISDRTEGTVSKWLFEDARTIRRIREGKTITLRLLERAWERLEAREAALGIESGRKPERAA